MACSDSDHTFIRPFASYTTFLSALQVLPLALSAAHITIGQPVALAILILAALTGYAVWHWWPVQLSGGTGVIPITRPSRLLTATIASAALTYLLLWVFAYFQRDLSWDGNLYHIPTLQFWAQRGYVHWIDQPSAALQWMNGYPKAVELSAFILVRATGSSHLLTCGNLLFLPLAVLALACMARALGASSQAAVAVGAAYLLVPLNINQAVTAYVDIGYAACVIALFAAALYTARCLLHEDRLPWTVVPLLGGAMGLTVGAKSPGPAAVILVLALLVLLALMRRPRWQPLAVLASTLAAACTVGGYWHARNYLHTGSPLYPIGVKLGSHVIFPGSTVDANIAHANFLPTHVQAWPDAAQVAYTWLQGLTWPGKSFEYDTPVGGLGYFWILACAPALVILLVQYFRATSRPARWRPFVWLLPVAIILFLITPMHWWSRYSLWIYAMGLPPLGLLFLSLGKTDTRRLTRAWLAACLLVLIIQAAWSLFWVGRQCFPGALSTNPSILLSRASWTWPDNFLFPELQGTEFDQIFHDLRPIALGPLDTGRGRLLGELSIPLGQRTLYGLDASASQLPALAHKVGYVVWDETVPIPPIFSKLAAIRAHRDGFWLFELRS
jgi:hypothetical protein